MARKLVGDLKPGDKVKGADGSSIRVTNAYHNPILEAREGKAWMIETEAGSHMANSLDEIEMAD